MTDSGDTQARRGSQGVPRSRGRGRVLEDFSMAQVIASALSAVTSLLLSSRIGVIGGVVGVAVGAAVAAVATQLYKGLLSASAERIRDAAEQQAPSPASAPRGAHAEPAGTASRPAAGTDSLAGRVAPAGYLCARGRRERLHRRSMAVIALASLASVALVAAIVHVATAGHGWGQRLQIPALYEPETQQATTQPTMDSESCGRDFGSESEAAATTKPATTGSGGRDSDTEQATTAATSPTTTGGEDDGTDANSETDASQEGDASGSATTQAAKTSGKGSG